MKNALTAAQSALLAKFSMTITLVGREVVFRGKAKRVYGAVESGVELFVTTQADRDALYVLSCVGVLSRAGDTYTKI